MALTLTQKALSAASLASLVLTGAAWADMNEGLDATQMAKIIAIYHNDSEPKSFDTDALTYARMDVIKAAYDESLDISPEVDSLTAARMLIIKTQFAEVLQVEPDQPLVFAK